MSSKGYTALGWLVWKLGSRAAKRKVSRNRSKLGAVAVIVALIGIGLAIAGGDDTED